MYLLLHFDSDLSPQLAEFDTPFNLIQKESGIFRSMCLKSGSFAELEATAKSKAEGAGTYRKTPPTDSRIE